MNSGELISNAELSALVSDSGNNGKTARPAVVPYNFRRPDRLSKEQIRGIYLLHDLFAHSLSSSLPLFLKAVCGISLISVEQQSFGDYTEGLSDPTTIYTLYTTELRGGFAIEISRGIAFPVIDRMLGGPGSELEETRGATDLELNILEGFVDLFLDSYSEAWKPIVSFEPEITARETRPALVQLAPPNEVVVTIAYQVQIGESKGSISICIPIATLESVMAELSPSRDSALYEEKPEERMALMNSLGNVRVPVTTALDPLELKYSDVADLKPGDVIKTTHRISRPVSITIGDKRKYSGSLARKDGQMVVRINSKH